MVNTLTSKEESADSFFWQNEPIFFGCIAPKLALIEEFGLKWTTDNGNHEGFALCTRNGPIDAFTFNFQAAGPVGNFDLMKSCPKSMESSYSVSLFLDLNETTRVGEKTTFFCAALLQNQGWIISNKTKATLKGEVDCFVDEKGTYLIFCTRQGECLLDPTLIIWGGS